MRVLIVFVESHGKFTAQLVRLRQYLKYLPSDLDVSLLVHARVVDRFLNERVNICTFGGPVAPALDTLVLKPARAILRRLIRYSAPVIPSATYGDLPDILMALACCWIRYRPHVFLFMLPPHAPLAILNYSALAKRSIVDIADPFCHNVTRRTVPTSAEYALESRVVNRCMGLVVTNQATSEHYQRMGVPSSNILVSYAGFDNTLSAQSREETESMRPSLTICFAGTFYEGSIEPWTLFQAVDCLYNGQSEAEQRWHVDVIGGFVHDPISQEKLLSCGYPWLTWHPLMPHPEVIEFYRGADILICYDHPEGMQIPSKLIELIATQKPVLLIGPESTVSDEICSKFPSIVRSRDSVHELISTLEILRSSSQTEKLRLPPMVAYSWANRCRELISFLNARFQQVFYATS